MKLFLLMLGVSFIPIWKDDMTNEGLNLWEYLHMFMQRDAGGGQHLAIDEAAENYRRNLYG